MLALALGNNALRDSYLSLRLNYFHEAIFFVLLVSFSIYVFMSTSIYNHLN